MQYVAQTRLKVVDRKDQTIIYKPGDVIPDFATWREAPRRALLNSRKVLQIEEADLAEVDKEIAEQPAAEKLAAEKTPAEKPQKSAKKTDDADGVHCLEPNCGKHFASERALKIHAKIKHKPE